MESWKVTVAGWKYKSVKFLDETKLLLTYLVREPFFELRDTVKSIWRSPATIFNIALIAFISILFIGLPQEFTQLPKIKFSIYGLLIIMCITQVWRIADSGKHRRYYREQHYTPDRREDNEVRIDDGKESN